MDALTILYLFGCCITFGVIGGIRDEMDGVGDIFCIFLWPAVLCCWLIYKTFSALVFLGVIIRVRFK